MEEIYSPKKNARRKKYFLTYSVVIMIGYAITQFGTFIGKQMGLSSITYTEIMIILVSTIGFTVLSTMFVVTKKIVTDFILQTTILAQFVFWLFAYGVWVVWLHEARILAMFFAFMPLIFLATNSNLLQSTIISIAVTIIQLGSSAYGIFGLGQSGSFKEVVFYTSWFFPSALYIAYVAGLFHKKRNQLKRAKRDAERARDALWGEMEIAKKIQTILLPEKPDMSGYEIASHMVPADEVGGDYYDIINVGGYNWIIIGDVSGHGVPAGLIMMMVQTSIHNTLYDNPQVSPSKLLAKINRTIAQNIKRMNEDKYMTITVFAELEDHQFAFSGLHQDIFIYRKKTETVEVIQTEGMWIGLMDDIDEVMEDYTFTLDKGDSMLLYTDGVTEAWERGKGGKSERGAENLFGEKKLQGILEANGNQKAEKIKSLILGELKNYISDDDITFLLLKRVK